MRLLSALLFTVLAAAPVPADDTLYASAATTKSYVVGAKLPPSGLFRKQPSGAWEQVGPNHPFMSAIAWEASNASLLYVAAGNGLIRLTDPTTSLRILTGSNVTELRDVAVDTHQPGSIYFSHTAGIAATHDAGRTWHDATGNIKRRYSEAIAVDRRRAGVLIAGTEAGIFRSDNAGRTWTLTGAAGFQVLRVSQSPHDACAWLAATQGGGLFSSRDCGQTFESAGAVGVNRTLNDIAWDPFDPRRIAIAGFGFGVAVSGDGGRNWLFRNSGLPRNDAGTVAFDPDHRDRIYAGIHEEALYLSEDCGKSWRADGLPGTMISRIQFVPAAVRP